jgi:dUTP pyrophosphatase
MSPSKSASKESAPSGVPVTVVPIAKKTPIPESPRSPPPPPPRAPEEGKKDEEPSLAAMEEMPSSQAFSDVDDDEDFYLQAKKIKTNVIRDSVDEEEERMKTTAKIQPLHNQCTAAIMPLRYTSGSVGYDVFSLSEITVRPKVPTVVPLGFALIPPENYYGQLHTKSSKAMEGIIVVGGVIDRDYRGEVAAILYNMTDEVITLPKTTAVCQLVFLRVATPSFEEFNVQGDKTERGERGCLQKKKKEEETTAVKDATATVAKADEKK